MAPNPVPARLNISLRVSGWDSKFPQSVRLLDMAEYNLL